MLTHTNTQNTLWRAWSLSGLGFGATRVCVGVVAVAGGVAAAAVAAVVPVSVRGVGSGVCAVAADDTVRYPAD